MNNVINEINQRLENILSQYPDSKVKEAMYYSLKAGGKRIRPLIVLQVIRAYGLDYRKYIDIACALEMIHTYSLIHDDLPGIDNDDFRHGKPTNHKKFNEATAILAGDALLNKAYIVISNELENSNEIDINKKLKVFKEFSESVNRMIIGEYVDTEFEGKDISGEYLEYIHNNKTGALLKLAVRMGAILADAKDEDLDRLTMYAKKIGLAFQIKDDILSEEGNEEILGKPVGNDKNLEKCTYVSKYGLEKSKEILDKITKEAIEELNKYDNKADFLRNLAVYIQKRNK